MGISPNSEMAISDHEWRWAGDAHLGDGRDAHLEMAPYLPTKAAYILRGWQVRLAVALAYARARFVNDALDALTTGAAAAGREREPYAYNSHPYSPRARFPAAAGRRASRLAS